MQLDLCVEGRGKEDAVLLGAPGLPSLTQLALMWKGGRSDTRKCETSVNLAAVPVC